MGTNRTTARPVAASTLALGLLAGASPPALAAGEGNDDFGEVYFLNDEWTGRANHEVVFSLPVEMVFMGDWDGNGTDTFARQRGNVIDVVNLLGPTEFDLAFRFGRMFDTLYTGDWDGNGTETFAVRRGNQYLMRNTLTDGPADRVVHFGRAGDTVLVGDWDGDGVDTFAVRRGNTYFLRNSQTSGPADLVVDYGRAADQVVVGDWDGDGRDSLGVRRGNTYYLSDAIADGPAEIVLDYGRPTDSVLVGDWDGDGDDTLGVRRPSPVEDVVLRAVRAASDGDRPLLDHLSSNHAEQQLWYAFQSFYDPPQWPTRVTGCGPVPGGIVMCHVRSDDYPVAIGYAYAAPDGVTTWQVVDYEIVADW
ncbi:hypothetical protein ACPYO6_07790 [Georgenia sp. Z1344]|uniref:hypothetical protein n=1 Tax=Georgenia sp. Z1344 TaxID=3416706 RepID=UPI003CF2E3E5